MITETTFQEQVDALEDDALRFGRAVVDALNAAAEGVRPECAVFENARVRHASAALLRSPHATAEDLGRVRAVQEAALHIRHIERAVAADGWRGDPRRLAAGLALALDVFVRRDLSGLRVLGRMIDVILEDPALGARALRRAARPRRGRGMADGHPAGEPAGHAGHPGGCGLVNGRRSPSVLVVEDDRVIAGSIGAHLRHAGMSVECVEDGDRALRKMRFERPDVVVLDLMLPGLDGWQVLRELRAGGTECPVVVVSARASEQDKVQVLKMGADDYVAKPFGMSELVARVEAVLRRSRITPQVGRPEKLTMPGLEIDPDLHRVLVDGADAGLTPLEFRLLQALTADSGRVLTRDQLRQRVWGVPQRKRDRSVDVCVRKLRSKIDLRSRTHVYIHTHPGVGYRFDPVPR